jgi:tRNA pseudouridine32 synthase/23S rRNA pseudouridine746 synthase
LNTDATAANPVAAAAAVELVHVDAHCIVAMKPSGLLSVPGRGPERADCLSARLRPRYPDALIVHRLDMSTSGLIVLARGIEAQRRLSRSFAERAVGKRYVAIVDGIVRADAGAIDLPLLTDWPNRPRQKIDPEHGKPALTRYRVESRDAAGATTRVELQPVTGRSHQLRLHMLALGHSILGDALYAPAAVRDRAGRLLLHAAALSFPHPASGQIVGFESAAPF